MKLSKYIDHTLLKQDATSDQIIKLCTEAKDFDFMSVCINPSYIELARKQLEGSDVFVCTVIGFPLGSMTTEAKVSETKDAVAKGAQEIDMVLNISRMIDGDFDYVENEIRSIKEACGSLTLKVIFETCLLNKEQIKKAAELSVAAGADFVKTSTGFSTGGATLEDVKLMKETVGDNAEVKASGGVRTPEDFQKMIDAGATRIGTSSGALLIQGKESDSDY